MSRARPGHRVDSAGACSAPRRHGRGVAGRCGGGRDGRSVPVRRSGDVRAGPGRGVRARRGGAGRRRATRGRRRLPVPRPPGHRHCTGTLARRRCGGREPVMTPAPWPWRKKSGEDAGAPGTGDPAGATDHARTDGNELEPEPRAQGGPVVPAPGSTCEASPYPPSVSTAGTGTSSSVRVEVPGEGSVGAGHDVSHSAVGVGSRVEHAEVDNRSRTPPSARRGPGGPRPHRQQHAYLLSTVSQFPMPNARQFPTLSCPVVDPNRPGGVNRPCCLRWPSRRQ